MPPCCSFATITFAESALRAERTSSASSWPTHTIHQELGAEQLLKYRPHHRAAADVANTDT